MGIPLSEMPLWDPFKAQGGAADPADYARAKMILWKGFCSVHQRFTVEQVERARKAYPGVKVIVHPECSMQVVDASDGTGSTAYIVKEIANAPAGSAIAVGTEINLVNRLAAQYPDKTVFCLDPVVCPCSTMYRIHPGLPGLGFGEPRSRQRGQSHHRGRRHRPRSQGGTGAHAARSPVIRPWRSSYMRGAVRVAD